MTNSKKALIVGLGIAGMATAIRLKDAGWEPIIIEKTPTRRTGGYFIGLFPEGKEAATKLGVLDHMHLRTATGSNTWEMNELGDRTRSAGFLNQPGGPEGVLRGDIEAALWERVDGRVEVRYGTVPLAIRNDRDSATVTLRHAGLEESYDETFDLVIGADGLRSTVRSMVFGPHKEFMKPLNRMICAFQLDEQLPNFDERDGVVIAEPGRSLWVFPLADRTPTALFTYETHDENSQFARPAVEVLRERYEGMSGHGAIPFVLDQLEKAPDFLFDTVYRVEMPTMHKNRVVMLGDAAWCLTLYSGMGASSGMAGAAALGDALESHPDSIEDALVEWETTMRPKIKKWRSSVAFKSQVFVPANGLIARLRTALLRRGGRAIAKGRRDSTAPAKQAPALV